MMNPQIQKVIYYIEKHLDDELHLEDLAKIAGYSPFHFCRIFKIHLGESAISYITRLKLERAAREMMLEKSIIEIALDAGYKTPTGFLKAFKSRFGTTPSDYRQGSYIELNRYKNITINTPIIVSRDLVEVIFTRELGEYKKSAKNAWEKLGAQIKENDLIDLNPSEGEALGICYDDPNITNPSNIRYEAAHSWDNINELKNYGFETKCIAGGRYAKGEYLGISNGDDAWYGLYAWIENNGYHFRNEPPFEKYLNGAVETDLEKFEVEVYVPIM